MTLPPNGPLTGGQDDFSVTIDVARDTRLITVTEDTSSRAPASVLVSMGGPEKETLFPYPSPFNPRSGPMTFRFRLNRSEGAAVIVKDRFGQDVWHTEVNGVPEQNEVQWDGRNENGHIVAAGVYYALLEVGGEIRSKKQFGVVK